jgi:hypothetical protein
MSLLTHKSSWGDKINMMFKEIVCEDVDWIQLAQDRIHKRRDSFYPAERLTVSQEQLRPTAPFRLRTMICSSTHIVVLRNNETCCRSECPQLRLMAAFENYSLDAPEFRPAQCKCVTARGQENSSMRVLGSLLYDGAFF